MLELVLFFLAVSILLYALFGGADFGAGILEAFKGRHHRKAQEDLITKAMGPVWEANHVWLILAVVILFMGFPRLYQLISIHLHLPLLALLVGIIARGCAFTFRHYDAVKGESQRVYSLVFALSSLWTGFWLGVLLGALSLGRINTESSTYFEAYVAPWYNVYCVLMGLFVLALFAFLASCFLIGETKDPELKRIFKTRARYANVALVLSGAVVLSWALITGESPLVEFFLHPISLTAFILASLLLFPVWYSIGKEWTWRVRLLGATLVGLVIIGWFGLTYPVALITISGPVTFAEAQAPAATLFQLLVALLFGSVLIFPALIYLLKIFKTRPAEL